LVFARASLILTNYFTGNLPPIHPKEPDRMLNWLLNLISWLTGLWSKIPEPVKEKIIDMIVDTFEAMFREFFRSEKRKKEEEHA